MDLPRLVSTSCGLQPDVFLVGTPLLRLAAVDLLHALAVYLFLAAANRLGSNVRARCDLGLRPASLLGASEERRMDATKLRSQQQRPAAA